MKLPHYYRGFEIVAAMTIKSGQWQLVIQAPGEKPKVVRRYKPPMQHHYIGSGGAYAYDHDVRILESDVDKNLEKWEPIRVALIPEEHREDCPTCGRVIDKRDLGAVLSHGQWDSDLGKYTCFKEMHLEGVTARKVGDPVEWKDGKPHTLN